MTAGQGEGACTALLKYIYNTDFVPALQEQF